MLHFPSEKYPTLGHLMQALDVISVATAELGDGQHAHVQGIIEAKKNPRVVGVQLRK